MSQDFIDAELFADFIVEAKEHLETIEPNLLELEKTPGNLSLLNEIFRPMHSLKGASGFLGLNRINGLAHKAENILDALRKGAFAANSEIMDLILAATDLLRQMIDNLEVKNTEGDVDTAPLMAALDALLEEQLAGKTTSPAEAALPAFDPSGAVQGGSSVEAALASEQLSGGKFPGDVESWLASLPRLGAYALTAFGEGHLKDFIEEAHENTSSLSSGLLELEKHPVGQEELVNDLFRYFHNLKGNSGIIGYTELNSLTHEAETLLNAVRKDSYPVSTALVDLLLLVVDVLDALISCIDSVSGQVTPFEIDEILNKLRQAVGGGTAELPDSLRLFGAEAVKPERGEPSGKSEQKEDSPDPAPLSLNADVLKAFAETSEQQIAQLDEALQGMKQDGSNSLYPDAMYRSLTTIHNSCKIMQLEEIKVYAERTAGIINQGRSTGLDFSLLTDLLAQEIAIISDMLHAALHGLEERLASAQSADTEDPTVLSEPEAAVKGAESSLPKTGLVARDAQPDGAVPSAPQTAVQPDAPSLSGEAAGRQAVSATASPAPAKQAGADKTGQAAKHEEGAKSSSTIRVDHEKLDHLMNLIGELIINRNRYAMLARQLEDNHKADIGLIAQNLSETTYALARISDDLQDTIMKVRMVPVASVFSRFPRLVRDLSRKSGKDVELLIEGDDTELDKSVVEVIGDPLVHLIRNSMDHGIEPAEARKEAAKNPQGKVCLRAYYKGNSVAIEVEDDGRGIDPEKMREVAVKKGIISAEDAKQLDDREATELIFAPGFSTADKITDISGRGVGMDVVRTNIKNLKGSISIQTEIGKGTKFILQLPLTLAIIDALMVNVADEMYAIPLDAVSETTKLEASRLTDVKGRKAVTLRGDVLGVVSLAELLGLPCHMDEQAMLSVVVIQDNERRLGLVVDSLLERQEIVIKPLGSYLGDLKGISGATIMGDGSVILILEPHEIYTLATSKA